VNNTGTKQVTIMKKLHFKEKKMESIYIPNNGTKRAFYNF